MTELAAFVRPGSFEVRNSRGENDTTGADMRLCNYKKKKRIEADRRPDVRLRFGRDRERDDGIRTRYVSLEVAGHCGLLAGTLPLV